MSDPISGAQSPAGRFEAEIAGFDIQVRSQPGFPDWDVVTPAAELIADRITIPEGGRVLCWGTGHGAAIAAMLLATPTASATLMVTNLVERDAAEATASRNQVVGRVGIINYPRATPEPGAFDLMVIVAGQDRDLNRRWLLESLNAARTGGTIAVCGPNSGGIRSLIDDATGLYGAARDEISQRKQRLGVYVIADDRPAAPAWTTEDGITPGTWATFSATLAGQSTELVTLPGVFSGDGLDDGTALLLDHLPDLVGKRVLDLGCGNGPIGIAAARGGAALVTMTDVNLLAVAAVRENIARAGATNATAVASDLYGAIHDQRFDVILCNPPFHAGQRVDLDIAQQIVRQAPSVLADDGEIVLVANRFLAWDKALRETFGASERVAETERYHVLSARQIAVAPPEPTPEAQPEAFVITDEMRERFPIIDNPERPKRKAETRRRSSRSIRRGPHRRR